MNDEELRKHLEFECHAHNAALRSDAEQHGLPYEPVTFEEYTRRCNATLDDSLNRPKLKPCLYCQRPTTLAQRKEWYFVGCECGVRGPEFNYRHLAVQGWNRMCGQNVTLMSITRTDEEESCS